MTWRLLNVSRWEARTFCPVEDGQSLTNFEKGLDDEVCTEQLRGCGRRPGQRPRACARAAAAAVLVNKTAQVREGEGTSVGMSNINKAFRDCARTSVGLGMTLAQSWMFQRPGILKLCALGSPGENFKF